MFDSNRLQRLQQAPLWDFACQFYAHDDVEPACLTLQDHAGVDICELLFHCWLYRYALQVRPKALIEQRAQRQAWQQRVTQTLRALRRDLKPDASQSDSIHRLRETIKRAELQAERENLDAWQTFAWHSNDVLSILDEAPENATFIVKWLQDRLFSTLFAPALEVAPCAGSNVESAWLTIARCLDPVKSSR